MRRIPEWHLIVHAARGFGGVSARKFLSRRVVAALVQYAQRSGRGGGVKFFFLS